MRLSKSQLFIANAGQKSKIKNTILSFLIQNITRWGYPVHFYNAFSNFHEETWQQCAEVSRTITSEKHSCAHWNSDLLSFLYLYVAKGAENSCTFKNCRTKWRIVQMMGWRVPHFSPCRNCVENRAGNRSTAIVERISLFHPVMFCFFLCKLPTETCLPCFVWACLPINLL